MSFPIQKVVADLNDLKTIGAVDLPMLAGTYAAANQAVSRTDAVESYAFTSPGSGGWDLVRDAWADLRNEVQDIYGHTASAVEDLAGVMLHIVDAYAATDTAAAAELDRAWRDGPPQVSLASGEYVPGRPVAVTLSTGAY